MKTQQTLISKLYFWIDIHKKSWEIHTAANLFNVKSFSIPADPEQLYNYVQKHYLDCVFEVGDCGY